MKKKILIVVMTLLVVCTLFCTVASAKVYNPQRDPALFLVFEGQSFAYPFYTNQYLDVDVDSIPQFFDVYTYMGDEFILKSNGRSANISCAYLQCIRNYDGIEINCKIDDGNWYNLYKGKGHDFVMRFYGDNAEHCLRITIYDSLDNELVTFFTPVGYGDPGKPIFNGFYYSTFLKDNLPEGVSVCYGFPDPDYSHDVIKVITGSIGGLVKDFGSSIGNGFVMLFYPNNQLSSFGVFSLSLVGVIFGFAVVNFIIKLFRRKK